MVERARRSLLTGPPDQRLRDIPHEVMQYEPEDKTVEDGALANLIMPLEVIRDAKHLTIATTSATLGSNLNVTLQELFIETAYPMNEESEATLLELVSS